MKIAFYKAKYGGIGDWIIALGTGGPVSHVEIIFDDGRCFSSTPYASEGVTGVRYSDCETLGIDLEKAKQGEDEWEVIELGPVPSVRMKDIEKWCDSQIGKPYDWLGIIGFPLGIVSAIAVGVWAIAAGLIAGVTQWATVVPMLIWMATTLIGIVQSRSKWYCSKIASALLFRWHLAPIDRIAQSPNSMRRKLRGMARI